MLLGISPELMFLGCVCVIRMAFIGWLPIYPLQEAGINSPVLPNTDEGLPVASSYFFAFFPQQLEALGSQPR